MFPARSSLSRTAAAVTCVAAGALAFPSSAADNHGVFDATVKIGECSGAIVRFDDQTDRDQALVLTNGHCHKHLPEASFEADLPADRNADVLAGEKARKVGTIHLNRMVYSTMTGTDVTFYESDLSYKEIAEKFGVTAKMMSDQPPAPGTAVAIPAGFSRTNYSCAIAGIVPLVMEGPYRWDNSLKYTSGCRTKPGTSGAPVIDASTGRVIAVNNTGFGGEGSTACTIGQPCEVRGNRGVQDKKGYYGQQTALASQCFVRGKLDLNAKECKLYKGGPTGHPRNIEVPSDASDFHWLLSSFSL